jgi:ABC-type transporter Mla subunit MlaD
MATSSSGSRAFIAFKTVMTTCLLRSLSLCPLMGLAVLAELELAELVQVEFVQVELVQVGSVASISFKAMSASVGFAVKLV